MSRKNIFITGFNKFNLNELQTIKDAGEYNFVPLLTEKEMNIQIEKTDNHEVH